MSQHPMFPKNRFQAVGFELITDAVVTKSTLYGANTLTGNWRNLTAFGECK